MILHFLRLREMALSLLYPLIVTIIVDDIGYGDWNSHNTPYMKSLHNESVLFTRGYHPESVCTPNRASLMSSRYHIDVGMSHNNLIHRILMSVYTDAGLSPEYGLVRKIPSRYRKTYIGKYHIGIGDKYKYGPLKHGYDDAPLYLPVTNSHFCSVNNKQHPPLQVLRVFSGQFYDEKMTIRNWQVALGLLCIFIITMIETKDPRALVIWGCGLLFGWYILFKLTMYNPDNCMLMCNETIVERRYEVHTLTERFTNVTLKTIREAENAFIMLGYDKMHKTVETMPRFRTTNKTYVNGLHELDYNLRRINDELDKTGKGYILVILSDNGHHAELEPDASGFPLRGGKSTSYDGGVRTKIFFKSNLLIPQVLEEPVSSMDIFPTLLDFTGVSTSKGIEGRSLVPLLRGEEQENRNLFFYCGSQIFAMLCDKHLKVHFKTPECRNSILCRCEGIENDPPLIYNITEDPSESIEVVRNISSCISTYRERLEKNKNYVTVLDKYPSIFVRL